MVFSSRRVASPAAAALGLLVLAAVGCRARPEAPLPPPPLARPAGAADLAARVAFNSAQIVTSNAGEDRWSEVTIAIARDASAVYTFRNDVVLGKRDLEIGALNFERRDGARFSPFEGAPRVWAVTATLPDGRVGYAEGKIVETAIR